MPKRRRKNESNQGGKLARAGYLLRIGNEYSGQEVLAFNRDMDIVGNGVVDAQDSLPQVDVWKFLVVPKNW